MGKSSIPGGLSSNIPLRASWPRSDRSGAYWTAILFSPLALLILAASLVGLVVSARSLQIGKAVPVIALTSVAANALTIAAGPIVFAEPFPDDPTGATLRVAAFALVIGAAALTPAPVSAAERIELREARAS